MTAANRVRCQVHTTGSLLILSLAAWGLAVIHAPPAGAAFPGANGRIAFDAAIDLDYDLYVVNPSGTRMRRMFDTPSNEYEPAWSPDSSRVAFSADRSGTRDIYAADPDGTGLLQLTSGTATDFDPAWSADGTQVVFTRLDVGYSLMVVDADGSNLQTLLHASAFEAKYSPDGTRIAFSDGNDIAVMNSDGSGLTRLTNTDDYDFSPDWSPDGSQIVFSSNRNGFTPSPQWPREYGAYLRALINRDDSIAVVAREGLDVVGYAVGRITTLPSFFEHRSRGYIHDVFVKPEHRRRGIGRQLVDEILQWLEHRSVTLVELTVAANNDAIPFWERLGFRVYMHQMKRELES